MVHKRILGPFLLLAGGALLLTPAAFAQQRVNDVSFQYGFLSIDQANDIFKDAVSVVTSLGNFYKDNVKYSGVPFLTFHYSANSRFGFGGAIGYYSLRGDLVAAAGGADAGDFRERDTIAAAELDYHWIMRPRLQVYSGGGFGLRVRSGTYTDGVGTDKTTKILPTFHLTAIGFRFGRKIGFFGELGAGYKGILSVGIDAQF
ncbi:MAG TPA: hypothetical protein VLJ16_07195 [Acidobacteriota bacterium]|nr:hypothetical protein [Acidobacteriota bacterium]